MCTINNSLKGKIFKCANGALVEILEVLKNSLFVEISNDRGQDPYMTDVDNGYFEIALLSGKLQPSFA